MKIRFLLFAAVPVLCVAAVAPAQAQSAPCPQSPASPTVTICTPSNGATVSSPIHVSAGTTSSTPVTAMKIYLDGTAVFSVAAGQLDTTVPAGNGAHRITVKAWNKGGQVFSSTVNVTVAAASSCTLNSASPSVTICTPANNAVVPSPVHVVAGTTSSTAIKTMKIYLDGTAVFSIAASQLDTTVPAANGAHRITVKAWNTGGQVFSSTINIQVGSAPPPPPGDVTAIQHVVFMLQENRSFDSYFGMLNPYRHAKNFAVGDDGKTYDVDGIDDKLNAISNVNDEGTAFRLFKTTSTCLDDMTSAWLESYGDVSRFNFTSTRNVAMDGFVHVAENSAKNHIGSGTFNDTIGKRAMAFYDDGFLNYYYFMASQFAISDRWFSPIASKSIPNRVATMSGGTTQGLTHDPILDDHFGQLPLQTIFQKLDGAGVSWKIYYSTTDDNCLAGDGDCNPANPNKFPATTFTYFSYAHNYLYNNPSGAPCTGSTIGSQQAVGDPANAFCIDPKHIAPLTQYFTDVQNNGLPQYSFIEAGFSHNDEHPGSGQSILNGQSQIATVINALMKSPSWMSSVFFFSYDEGGGPYDHVPPVPTHTNDFTTPSLGVTTDVSSIAVNPDSFLPCPSNGTTHCDLTPNDPGSHPNDVAATQGFAAQIGFRVPNMIVSPFTRKHFVSHTPMDHTAIIKFVESRFIGSSAHITNRDAAQPNLLEFFDFKNVPWATPPSPPAPVTPTSLGFNPCTPDSMGP